MTSSGLTTPTCTLDVADGFVLDTLIARMHNKTDRITLMRPGIAQNH